MDDPIGIAGAGRVARALGRLLAEAGEPVTCAVSRDPAHAADAARFIGTSVESATYRDFPPGISRWIVAVPDRALTEVAMLLAERSNPRIALHTCGAKGPEVLAPLEERGAACGTLHPFQTITLGAEGVAALRGCGFGIWGHPAGVEWAERIVNLAHGVVLRIRSDSRPIYHAAAVMASNYVCALLDSSQALLETSGVDSSAALRALGPIVRTAVENALACGPAAALTGPIERGDVATVDAHLKALAAAPATVRRLYRAAGLQTLDLARRRGLEPDRAQQLDRLLTRD